MVTVRGNVFPPAESGSAGGAVAPISITIDESMSRTQSLEIVAEDTVALDKANIVIAGGAGLGDEDGFELLEELAEALGQSFGSVMIGCSRMAVDKGWISSDHQIGLTGTIIAPDVYVAVGISGAIHHLVGMVHSKKIIAINTDPSCNIFKVADYGIVEDYEQVLPTLIKRLEEVL
ncbi:electron transfer flavoprotein subunit alpha/FixB family protein [Desulfosarcina cetonica]|uniref:electron transfer flavoprotein subunit alpha/FixB family protein n=1 Tax=Desulfosarcina cetonica TaxID=90730 RepID=UPI00278BB457|nr:electron transfer flavoprotein subunit alpha/FixB family protein [Desulfosarcina cetonica]